MPYLVSPNADPDASVALTREFNPYHEPAGSSVGGQFAEKPGPSVVGAGWARRAQRVRLVHTIEEAVSAILKGEVVELRSTQQVSTVLTRLAQIAQDALARGEKAPNYDLCNVSVRGTNLFCSKGLRTKEYPRGIPRIKMPQFTGTPRPGSEAAKLPRIPDDPYGNVDATPQFLAHLTSLGITTEQVTVRASQLKASQSELVGPTVAAMMANSKFDPTKGSIWTSRDDYVVDGHHRWATAVGRDAADGRLGDVQLKATRINAPISLVLLIAREWTQQFGILPQSA